MSAVDELEANRRAIRLELLGTDQPPPAEAPGQAPEAAEPAPGEPAGATRRPLLGSAATWIDTGKLAIEEAWRQHPARPMALVAESMLEEAARRKPYYVIGAAALLGGALVLLRPWRWASARGVVVAAVAPLDLKGVVSSVVAQSLLAGREDSEG
ncbi:MAG TPA: hypothetical protein PKD73_04820 [Burkholderiaceae bacterium]|jgi:hypothetical protein|nr:hypothetical protein [Burkholderiaceae bacterium]